jgi:hypothetical protein
MRNENAEGIFRVTSHGLPTTLIGKTPYHNAHENSTQNGQNTNKTRIEQHIVGFFGGHILTIMRVSHLALEKLARLLPLVCHRPHPAR